MTSGPVSILSSYAMMGVISGLTATSSMPMSVGFDVKQQYADANLDLLARFMEMIFEDPSILDEIPAQATLSLLPDDDPELAATNRRGAERFAREGRPFYLRSMPPAPSASPTTSRPKSEAR